jgi:hypothetical protein
VTKPRKLIAGIVLAVFVAGIMWQFAPVDHTVHGAMPMEGEVIVKEAAIGFVQHAYPEGSARELSMAYPLLPSPRVEEIAKSGEPCEIVDSCRRQFAESHRGLSWDVIGPAGAAASEAMGLFESLKNWAFQRRLNRTMAVLAHRQYPKLGAVKSSDPFLIDLCLPSENSPFDGKRSCSTPAIVGSFAFVKVVSDCGGLCGATSLIALERRDGTWVAVATSLLAQE